MAVTFDGLGWSVCGFGWAVGWLRRDLDRDRDRVRDPPDFGPGVAGTVLLGEGIWSALTSERGRAGLDAERTRTALNADLTRLTRSAACRCVPLVSAWPIRGRSTGPYRSPTPRKIHASRW
ncbi:MAG: hypothetical protein JO169_07245 [Solirubrobacterales bacterium]|nr:hypothetical protein [Solirubrobacterales bacterium]